MPGTIRTFETIFYFLIGLTWNVYVVIWCTTLFLIFVYFSEYRFFTLPETILYTAISADLFFRGVLLNTDTSNPLSFEEIALYNIHVRTALRLIYLVFSLVFIIKLIYLLAKGKEKGRRVLKYIALFVLLAMVNFVLY